MTRIRKLFQKIIGYVLSVTMPVCATQRYHQMKKGKRYDLKNPRTINEKMQWLKLNTYWKNPMIKTCSDKYAVREYVKQCGLEHTLLQLYGVWDDAREIDWENLPNSFVLKCNHASGYNIVCRDKEKLDKAEAIRKLNEWRKTEYGLVRAEYSYCGIPRKMIAEELIDTPDGLPPQDYKIFCSYGEPKLVYVISDRLEKKADYFTPEWEWIPVCGRFYFNAQKHPEKPKNYEEMLEVARGLSKEFPIVRVDLYNENNQVLFGELTFLHAGGHFTFTPQAYDGIFGDLFDIQREMVRTKRAKPSSWNTRGRSGTG